MPDAPALPPPPGELPGWAAVPYWMALLAVLSVVVPLIWGLDWLGVFGRHRRR